VGKGPDRDVAIMLWLADLILASYIAGYIHGGA
jgi:hypothetical protein